MRQACNHQTYTRNRQGGAARPPSSMRMVPRRFLDRRGLMVARKTIQRRRTEPPRHRTPLLSETSHNQPPAPRRRAPTGRPIRARENLLPSSRHSRVGGNPFGALAPRRGATRPSPLIPGRHVIPAKAGTYCPRHSRRSRDPTLSPSFPRPRDPTRRASAIAPRRGATRPVPLDPQRPRHSRESGNLLKCPL